MPRFVFTETTCVMSSEPGNKPTMRPIDYSVGGEDISISNTRSLTGIEVVEEVHFVRT